MSEEPLKCGFCNKLFISDKSLSDHKIRSKACKLKRGEQFTSNHQCDRCLNYFGTNAVLQIHLNRKYKCQKKKQVSKSANKTKTEYIYINQEKVIIGKTEYIYMLQEREFIKTNEFIYKIGRTEQKNSNRFREYPKGTVLIAQLICNDCVACESEVMTIFKDKYKQRLDIGTEYFEGDWKQMFMDLVFVSEKSHSLMNNEHKNHEA